MSSNSQTLSLYSTLEKTIQDLIKNFGAISDDRKKILRQLTSFVDQKVQAAQQADLIFICTHNSRRSHLSQIWAQTAAHYYGIKNVIAYSGGTEATAFNPRAVKAMEEAGFKIVKTTPSENPVYEVYFAADAPPVIAFSKKYDALENPSDKFAAVMTCSHADENCPVVVGMEKRISLPYNDPKDYDGTPHEAEKYWERVREIGTEILFAFSKVNNENVKR